jgi:hypothetical protein
MLGRDGWSALRRSKEIELVITYNIEHGAAAGREVRLTAVAQVSEAESDRLFRRPGHIRMPQWRRVEVPTDNPVRDLDTPA